MDVLSASMLDDKIAWYANDGSGGFSAQRIISTSAKWAKSVYAGDLDGDGDLDVMSASYGKIAWYENLTGTDIEKNTINPVSFSLHQNYPNPFNPMTVISYQLSAISQVELSVYNLMGQKVVTLVSEKQNAGSHQFEWNAIGLASGIYFYRLHTAAGFVQTRKLMVIK